MMTRRQLVRAAAGWSAALLVPGWGWLEEAAAAENPAAAHLFGRPASPYAEPVARRSAGGLLRTRLQVAYANHRIGQDKVRLRSYEGSLVGPTLRFRAGDVVEIELINQLPAEPAVHHHRNGPHELNTTNLHVHGLHVSPAGRSDNVLIRVPPGQRQQYRFEIPKDHPAGTFYYHPHKHGSTAVQLGNGMGGALIVEGDIDQVPAIKAARERVLMLQQIPYHRRTGTVDWREVLFEDVRTPTTINGRLKPRLELRPGEVQRWRLVHAGMRAPIDILLVDGKGNPTPLHQIAVDGITTGRLEPLPEVELGPGNRADVLVQVEAPGSYYLINREVVLRNLTPHRQVLAEVTVAGPRLAMRLPRESELQGPGPVQDAGAGTQSGEAARGPVARRRRPQGRRADLRSPAPAAPAQARAGRRMDGRRRGRRHQHPPVSPPHQSVRNPRRQRQTALAADLARHHPGRQLRFRLSRQRDRVPHPVSRFHRQVHAPLPQRGSRGHGNDAARGGGGLRHVGLDYAWTEPWITMVKG